MLRKIIKKENVFEGKGPIFFEYLLDDEELNGMCRLYAKITIKPHSSLGYHTHTGESETYYILSGKGEYSNNGKIMEVQAGDVTFTPGGHGHSIANHADEDLILIALIIYDEKRS